MCDSVTMNSFSDVNKLRFRTYYSMAKGYPASVKDSTIVRLYNGRWLCVRKNGVTGQLGLYQTAEDWMRELPTSDGLVCLNMKATRAIPVERKPAASPPKRPATSIKLPPLQELKLRLSNIALCLDDESRIYRIIELFRFIARIPDTINGAPGLCETVLQKCAEFKCQNVRMRNEELEEAILAVQNIFCSPTQKAAD
jgi:hypothetical protein